MRMVRAAAGPSGGMILWIDVVGKAVNSISTEVLGDLAEALDRIEREGPGVVVFASGKARSFVAGADLFEMARMGEEELARFIARGQEVFGRIRRLPMPTVAAINGDCLGGGLELALACGRRVAVDEAGIAIGLPEVRLGILPAWGGTTYLPRAIGLRRALPMLLAGKTISPARARQLGLVDELCEREALLRVAEQAAGSGARGWWPAIARGADLGAVGPVRRRVLRAAGRMAEAIAQGHYPAPPRILEVVAAGYDRGVEAGLEAERRAILDLAKTEVSRNLMRNFFLRQQARKAATAQAPGEAGPVEQVAVIGGGTMGSGIAVALAAAGLGVQVVEADAAAAAEAIRRVRRLIDEEQREGRLDREAAGRVGALIEVSADYGGVGRADVVIEAVVEDLDVKLAVFARLGERARADAVLASNTSSLLVGQLAAAVGEPQRVVGMHFFNPAMRMPLVEIVRGPHSGGRALATALALAGRMGKTPIVVGDSAGFLVNRLLVPYLAEAVQMAIEGMDIGAIDAAMRQWGMPMGPMELMDEIGLDVCLHMMRSIGQRCGELPDVIEVMGRGVERGWKGRKCGRGFYLYDESVGSTAVQSTGFSLLGEQIHEEQAEACTLNDCTPNEIQWRLVLPMVNEAARALGEGVVSSTDTIDLATVLGLNMAPFRGGLARFADAVGVDQVVARLSDLAAMHGRRFAPAMLLHRLAEAGLPLEQSARLGAAPVENTQGVQHAYPQSPGPGTA